MVYCRKCLKTGFVIGILRLTKVNLFSNKTRIILYITTAITRRVVLSIFKCIINIKTKKIQALCSKMFSDQHFCDGESWNRLVMH